MSGQTANMIHSRTLSGNQIRVLALQQGEADDPLECQIHFISILKKTSYEAISYVWGTQVTTDVIRCRLTGDGEKVDLPLTRNAADALRAVRMADSERLVWIDSICISQTSDVEKAAQVAMMDVIFANATSVLIWLGADDGLRSAAAAEIATLIHEHFGHEMRFGKQGTRKAERTATADPIARQKCYDELGSVMSLFECEWFWRLWCVQELVLAKQAFIHWGSIVLPWDTILTVAAFVDSKAQLYAAHMGVAGVYNVVMLECLRKDVKSGDKSHTPFSRLLSLTRLYGVTEPCDRIFSLLGLDLRLCRRYQPLLKPDYSKGTDSLYLSTARALLARERNLHLLSFVQHEGDVGEGDLPSWVPQWHVNKHRLLTQFDLIPGHPDYALLQTALAKRAVFADTPPSYLRWRNTVGDDGTLYAEGLLLATVAKSCSNVAFATDPGHEWLQTLRQWFQSVPDWLNRDDQPDLQDIPPSQPHDDVVFRRFYRTLLGGHFREKGVFKGLRKELPAFRALLYSDDTDDTDACPITRAFATQICRSRTVYLTDKGQLGIGPQRLQPGDSVCFLEGAAIPLLLRPRSSPVVAERRWLLVGETFVNGLAGPSRSREIAEDFEASRSSEDEEDTTTGLLNPKTKERKSFLYGPRETEQGIEVARSFMVMSNRMLRGPARAREIYYSEHGTLHVQGRTEEQRSYSFVGSPAGEATEDFLEATIDGFGERMRFYIN